MRTHGAEQRRADHERRRVDQERRGRPRRFDDQADDQRDDREGAGEGEVERRVDLALSDLHVVGLLGLLGSHVRPRGAQQRARCQRRGAVDRDEHEQARQPEVQQQPREPEGG